MNTPINFIVLTVLVQDITESKHGKATIAGAVTPGDSSFSLRVVALNGVRKSLKSGEAITLIGRLGYEEHEGTGTLVLYPQRSEKPDLAHPKNRAKLTLRLGADGESRYTEAGRLWTRARMFLGQGKDAGGEYKPSLWLNVKGFTRDGDERIPLALSVLSKGQMATITGRLACEVYNGRTYYDLLAGNVEPFSFDSGESTSALVGEPA